jgi:hypothetical protein
VEDVDVDSFCQNSEVAIRVSLTSNDHNGNENGGLQPLERPTTNNPSAKMNPAIPGLTSYPGDGHTINQQDSRRH